MIFFKSMKGKNYRVFFQVFSGMVITCFGCGQTRHATTAQAPYPPLAPDYQNLDHWAAHPRKYDLSDSLPAPYKPLKTDSSVDVFFLHPTSYLDAAAVDPDKLSAENERLRWNASLSDATINNTTDKGSMLNQASIFNGYRVFAPRYRQAHIKAFYIADSLSKPFFDTAYNDILTAFKYFLANENRGRPFIIAAHSQGTLHAARLTRELIDGKPLQQQFVAAYLVGLPVPENLFQQIAPCRTATSTGCVASWRTFKQGYEPPNVMMETFKAIVVNPLTWTTSTEPASRKQNKGAVLYKFNKPKPRNVAAVIHGNILWSSKPRFFGNILFTRKNYHIGDYNLFWKNIRDNVDERVQAFSARASK
jgi:hypothetical protein